MVTSRSMLDSSCLFLAFLIVPFGSRINAAEQRSRQESLKRYPEYQGDVPLAERISTRKNGDLTGNIAANRPLNRHDRDYILGLSDFIIDKQNDPGMRRSATHNVGLFGHQIAIPALLAVLRDDKDSKEVQREAVNALSKIKDKRVVDYLIEDGLGSEHIEVASQASDDLAQLVGGPLAQIPGVAQRVPKDLNDPDLEAPNFAEYREGRGDEYKKRYREYLRNLYQHKQMVWRDWWKKNRARVSDEGLNRAERWTQ